MKNESEKVEKERRPYAPPVGEEIAIKCGMMSVAEFRTKRAENVTSQAIDYAIRNGIIDYVIFGDRRLIVLTEKTLDYEPKANSLRAKKVGRPPRKVQTTYSAPKK